MAASKSVQVQVHNNQVNQTSAAIANSVSNTAWVVVYDDLASQLQFCREMHNGKRAALCRLLGRRMSLSLSW